MIQFAAQAFTQPLHLRFPVELLFDAPQNKIRVPKPFFRGDVVGVRLLPQTMLSTPSPVIVHEDQVTHKPIDSAPYFALVVSSCNINTRLWAMDGAKMISGPEMLKRRVSS